MLHAMNAALNAMGLRMTASAADATAWTVSDGKSLLRRYTDEMVIPPAAGQAGRGRALALLQAKGHPAGKAAEAATEASDAAAVASGVAGGRGRGRGRGGAVRYAPY